MACRESLRFFVLFLLVQHLQSSVWQSDNSLEAETSRFDRRLRGLEDAGAWKLWKHEHAKLYPSSAEELERYVVWRSNKAYIESHNEYSQEFGYSVRMNKFGDLVSQGVSRALGTCKCIVVVYCMKRRRTNTRKIMP